MLRDPSELQAGDLVVWRKPGGHVALFLNWIDRPNHFQGIHLSRSDDKLKEGFYIESLAIYQSPKTTYFARRKKTMGPFALEKSNQDRNEL